MESPRLVLRVAKESLMQCSSASCNALHRSQGLSSPSCDAPANLPTIDMLRCFPVSLALTGCLSKPSDEYHTDAKIPDMTVAHSGLNLKREMARKLLQLSIKSAAAFGLSILNPAVAKR